MSVLNEICSKHQDDVQDFMMTGTVCVHSELYSELLCYYVGTRQMPHEVVKARTQTPQQWITQHLRDDLATLH